MQTALWSGHVAHHDSFSKTILKGTLEGGQCLGWLKKELDGQHQRGDTPAHARTAQKGLLQKTLEEDLC